MNKKHLLKNAAIFSSTAYENHNTKIDRHVT